MKDTKDFIGSGLLELYVMGQASDEECREVEKMASAYPEVRQELDAITAILQDYAEARVEALNPTIRPLLIATIDYTERLRNGEPQTFPPQLHEGSTVEDYAPWLDRDDMQLSAEPGAIELRIIGSQQGMMTGILWLMHSAPREVHDDEIEKFLVIEGTCDIVTDKGRHSLIPGDYYAVPLHLDHQVVVTSSCPCKVILQRVAA